MRVDRLLLTNDASYVPTGIGPAESPYEAIISPSVLNSHVIDYTYDDLYRLTDAIYSGAMTAAYQYAYDGVGNMTAYTETVGTATTHVERTFDEANRLQTSFSEEEGTTTYEYDQNSNLILVTPQTGEPQDYAYDQRHLMTSSHTGSQTQAEFVYDGDGNRVQQVDYTGGATNTTIYLNDTGQSVGQVSSSEQGQQESPRKALSPSFYKTIIFVHRNFHQETPSQRIGRFFDFARSSILSCHRKKIKRRFKDRGINKFPI